MLCWHNKETVCYCVWSNTSCYFHICFKHVRQEHTVSSLYIKPVYLYLICTKFILWTLKEKFMSVCKIWVSQGGGYENFYLVGCDTLYSDIKLPAFRRNHSSILNMDAAGSSEILITFYHTPRREDPRRQLFPSLSFSCFRMTRQIKFRCTDILAMLCLFLENSPLQWGV